MVSSCSCSRKLATVAKFKVEKMRKNVDLRLVCSSLQHGDWQLLYALIQVEYLVCSVPYLV